MQIIFLKNINLSTINNTSLEFLIGPMITLVSHCISQCEVNALRTLKTGFSVYVALVAEPASGKSPAMRIIKKINSGMDSFYKVILIQVLKSIKDLKLQWF
jgi:hypothetical protein